MTAIKPKKHWELFSHEADMGVRGIGPTKEAAFEQAAMALSAVITDPKNIEPKEAINITCDARDDELLLVEWLNALIYEMSTRKVLFGYFELKIDDHHLQAKAWGEPVDINKHQPAVEVKGATFTNLKVSQDQMGEWTAQSVVDV
ncbi:MAG: archease [Acidobacteriota bacterium]